MWVETLGLVPPHICGIFNGPPGASGGALPVHVL
uniref:Uncharacterized protein n=1 Tax=Anguilla anguilla TaxID=7936 RepID=A0A0E9SB59_ANGAN